MNKSYLISITTAATVAYAAGLASDFSAQASVPTTKMHNSVLRVPADNPVLQEIKTRVEAAQCADVVASLGIEAEECEIRPGDSTTITWGEDETQVESNFHLQGTWTLGSPE